MIDIMDIEVGKAYACKFKVKTMLDTFEQNNTELELADSAPPASGSDSADPNKVRIRRGK